MNENTYYVYHHVCPISKNIMYIGHGKKARAWIHGSRKTVLRSQDHLDWLDELNEKGFLPCDYVKIEIKGLSKKSACKIENEQILRLKPFFNKPQGLSMLKVTSEMLKEMERLRGLGLSYSDTANEIGVSTMTVYRAVNGMTKNAGHSNE